MATIYICSQDGMRTAYTALTEPRPVELGQPDPVTLFRKVRETIIPKLEADAELQKLPCMTCGKPSDPTGRGSFVISITRPDEVELLPVCHLRQGTCFAKEWERIRMSRVLLVDYCAFCGKTGNMRRCTRCLRDSYCSITCQRADWGDHRVTRCGGREISDCTGEEIVRSVHHQIAKLVPTLRAVAFARLKNKEVSDEWFHNYMGEIGRMEAMPFTDAPAFRRAFFKLADKIGFPTPAGI